MPKVIELILVIEFRDDVLKAIEGREHDHEDETKIGDSKILLSSCEWIHDLNYERTYWEYDIYKMRKEILPDRNSACRLYALRSDRSTFN